MFFLPARTARQLAIALSAAFVLLGPTHARAAIKTWSGANSGSWSDGGNWIGGTPGQPPQTDDDLVFPAGPSSKASVFDYPSDFRVGTITLIG